MLSHALQKKAVVGLTICFSITASAYSDNWGKSDTAIDPAATSRHAKGAPGLDSVFGRYCPVLGSYADGFGLDGARTSDRNDAGLTSAYEPRASTTARALPTSANAYDVVTISPADHNAGAATTAGASLAPVYSTSNRAGTRSGSADTRGGAWAASASQNGGDASVPAGRRSGSGAKGHDALLSPTATPGGNQPASSPSSAPSPAARSSSSTSFSDTPSSSAQSNTTRGHTRSDPVRPTTTDAGLSGGSIEPVDSSRKNSHDRTGGDLTNVLGGVFDEPKPDADDSSSGHQETNNPSLSTLPNFQTPDRDGRTDTDRTPVDGQNSDSTSVDAGPADVPEPSSLGILALGALAIIGLARRRKMI